MNERSPVKPKQGGMNKRWRGNIKWQGNKHEGKTLHFKANMTILILIRINQYHMREKRNQDQVIRVEKESLTRVRSDATIVKAGDTLQMNVEV